MDLVGVLKVTYKTNIYFKGIIIFQIIKKYIHLDKW